MKTGIRLIFLCSLSCVIFSLCPARSGADTIYTNDSRELKGIVVEDYKDRFTYSTADGEITVKKSDIREIYFDSEEDNIIKLADQCKERRDFTHAFAYYNMAFKKNPDSRPAKDGIVSLQGFLFRQEEARKEADVRRREQFETAGSGMIAGRDDTSIIDDPVEGLRKTMGLSLKIDEDWPEVSYVRIKSSADEAGIMEGDKLVAIWGRLTRYMQMSDIIDALLVRTSFETKCTIERVVGVHMDTDKGFLAGAGDLLGASLKMEFDGLAVSKIKDDGPAFNADLREGDMVTAIEGKTTRYMPLKKAEYQIRKAREKGSVNLTIRREIIIWRKT